VTADTFLKRLQVHAATFAKAVATKEGEWIIKGFIDIYRRIYTISVDTKIVSKVLELLLYPMFVEFGKRNGLDIKLCPHQNFYPDLTFIHERSGRMFAVDIKSTYRSSATEVNGMTLGAFTGYFRQRDSKKNTLYPYNQYAGHFVLGVIYSKCDEVADERQQFSLKNLEKIPSVIKDFQFFVQPKYKIASGRPGSATRRTSVR
jgi:Restriction endonuclease EcoRV